MEKKNNYTKDECDWCGEITMVKIYPKNKKMKYCEKCLKEVEECD